MTTKSKTTAPVNKTTRKPATTTEIPTEQSKSKKPVRGKAITIVLIIAIVVFGTIAIIFTSMVIGNVRGIRASRAENESLREIALIASATDVVDSDEFGVIQLGALDEEMRQINSDYVGWIRIDGTDVDYPVVRGEDNEKYLKTSFYGEESITGTVFMDYRITGDLLSYSIGEAIPHIIIYGHNLQQGGIFSDLRRLTDEQFLDEHNRITFIVSGQTIEFEIFSARKSDIHDPAFFLNFDGPREFPRFADRVEAPLAATQIITLSTCTRGGSDDERIIVQGYRLLS